MLVGTKQDTPELPRRDGRQPFCALVVQHEPAQHPDLR
jgi:hypothetical protein